MANSYRIEILPNELLKIKEVLPPLPPLPIEPINPKLKGLAMPSEPLDCLTIKSVLHQTLYNCMKTEY